MTFLEAYIKDKVGAYQEPSREGTPKGEPIGLFKPKYEAALWTGLTRRKLNDIADELGLSYPLIKKWRTEAPFKAAGQALVKDFAHKLFKHAFGIARQYIPMPKFVRPEEYIHKGIQLEGKPFPIIFKRLEIDLNDYRFYAKEVREIVSALLYEEFKKIIPSKLTDDEYRWELDRVLAVYRFTGIDDPPEITKAYSDNFNKNIRPQIYNTLVEGKRPLTLDETYTLVGSGSIVDDMKNR
jgi:hypothetical protein